MDSGERRSSPRRPIRLAAQIDLGDDGVWPCQIADFCAEGLFVRFSDNTSGRLDEIMSVRPDPEFTIRFRDPDEHKYHELSVSAVRRIRGAMGVHFTRPNPEAVDAMLQQCAVSHDQDPVLLRAPDDPSRFVLRQCARAITRYLEPLMRRCFPDMTEALKQAAEAATSDQLAAELMDAAVLLSGRQRILWRYMALHLEAPVKSVPSVQVSAAELALVDKSEFEEWLALRVMVTRADTRYREALLQLKLRLDKLGIANTTGHHNPLGPALICEAFHAGLNHLKLVREAEKVCLRTFDRLVLPQLAPLYQELNNILIRHGVLPDLNLRNYLSARSGEPARRQTAGTQGKSRKAPVDMPEAGAEQRPGAAFQRHNRAAKTAFTTVRSLVSSLQASRQLRDGGSVHPFPAGARPLPARELQRELHQLQAAGTGPVTGSLKQRVAERIQALGHYRLDEEQEQTLDVVDRFFRSVLESPKLNERARPLIRQLEIPVLKVAMRTPSFFEDSRCPARVLMDRLARLGMTEGRVSAVVYRRVEELVRRIAAEFEQDTAVFEQAAKELDTLIEHQQQLYRRNVERVTAAAEGAQKVAEAREAVARVLQQRLAGRRVPRVLVDLLDGGWRDLLVLIRIRQGPDSAQWQEYLSVIDALLQDREQPGAGADPDKLLQVIQEGLASISGNFQALANLAQEVKQFLLAEPGLSPEWVEVPVAEEDCSGSGSGTEQRRSGRWLKRVQQLRPGEWFRYQDQTDSVQYVRLVWVARDGSRFVFVNHQGMRVVDLHRDELADSMQSGSLVPDPDYQRPLVDESIERMVCSVYEELSRASTHDELTGLPRWREFERLLDQQLARKDLAQALVRLDLCHFHRLNDVAGYQAGDECLRQVADILRRQLGKDASLARLSGKEFAILVPAAQARTAAVALVGAIGAAEFRFDGCCYPLSANAGVVPASSMLINGEHWLRASERALDEARQQGPGEVVMLTADAAGHPCQTQVAAWLASPATQGEECMALRAQKIIPLHANTAMTAQYEVLISMYDEAGNLIAGQDFVRMAEHYGRTQEVDRWQVAHMLDWLREHRPDPVRVGGLCVNISGQSLNDHGLLEFVYEKLGRQSAPIERLWFCLSATSAIPDPDSVATVMNEMKELGCRFCLGNFGAGARSLHILRSLPVDLIRIDSAFTGQLNSSDTDVAMVRAMVDMAHYMGREVIASHVESREELDILRQLGVDYVQGFVVEKPRALDSLLSPV